MTDDLITRARAAMDGVTPGLWVASDAQWPEQIGCCPLVGRPYSISGTDCWNVAAATTLANAHFIASARDLVPALVGEVERLGKQCEGLMQAALGNGQALILAEAKVEKLFKALQAICATAHADDYVGWRTALEEATATLAEIGGYQK